MNALVFGQERTPPPYGESFRLVAMSRTRRDINGRCQDYFSYFLALDWGVRCAFQLRTIPSSKWAYMVNIGM